MSLEITGALAFASLQGPPVTGRRRFGVPPGGAFDQESYRLANSLAGNNDNELCLEIALVGMTLRAFERARLAIVGCTATLDDHPVPAQSSFAIEPGQRLELHAPLGCRSYVAANGGFRGLEAHTLFHRPTRSDLPLARLAPAPSSLTDRPLRIIPTSRFTDELLEAPLTVSLRSNRTGVRLEGFHKTHILELPSEPSCVGAVQHTPSGELILIGPDGPTIGGYPVVGVVCSADMDRIGQLKPGQVVSFKIR